MPAFVAPNVLKWHWWRFNGYGFLAGMVAGTAAAILKIFVPLHDVPAFLLILAISFVASVLVCLFTKPEPDDVLMSFYRSVRPWGSWGPIYEKCRRDDPSIQRNKDFSRDMFNIAVGLVWQTSLVTSPIYLVIQHWPEMWISLGICVVPQILKFTWYDHLGPGEMYLTQTACPRPGRDRRAVTCPGTAFRLQRGYRQRARIGIDACATRAKQNDLLASVPPDVGHQH